MGSADTPQEEGEDAGALSDFDEDEEYQAEAVELPPVVAVSTSGNGIGGGIVEEEGLKEKFKALVAELEEERQVRKSLEVSKAEDFERLKALIQEAARQRDEANRARDQALREVELVVKERDEVRRQRDESLRVKEEASRARDVAKTEIGESARILIGANEKISAMVNGVKSFGQNLPASQYTGMQAIAFGFGKRVEDIVEEILRQREAALKAHREVRDQMEQRNFSIAIEVSELEASVSQLKEEVAKKSAEAEVWKKQAILKDDKFLELEQLFSEKQAAADAEANSLRQMVQEVKNRFENLKVESDQHTEVLREGLKYMRKLRKCLIELPHEIDPSSGSGESSTTTSTASTEKIDEKQSLPQECLAGLKALLELATKIGVSWKEKKEDWQNTSNELVTRVERLVGQKQDAAELLATSLSEKQQVLETISDLRVDLSQQQSEVERLQLALKDAQEAVERQRVPDVEEENEELVRIRAELSLAAQSRDESLSKVSALEGEVNNLRQQIGELETALARTRSEVGELRTFSNSQAKEVAEKNAQIRELQLKLGDYAADFDALEEEIGRWKQAVTDEAAAGGAVLEDLERCQTQVAVLHQQISQLKTAEEEALLKLQSKEKMAVAAIAARTAAERSLQMADERAAELRDRLEELNKQVEEADRNREYGLGAGWLDMCWPWFRNRGRSSNAGGTQMAAEMEELLEPLV